MEEAMFEFILDNLQLTFREFKLNAPQL